MKTYSFRSINGIALLKSYIITYELYENFFFRKYGIYVSEFSYDLLYLHVILEPCYSTERILLKKYYT